MSSKCSIWARYFFLNSLLLLEKPRMHEKCFEFCFVDKRSIHPAAWWGPRQALASVGYKLGAGVSLAGSLGSPVGPVWEGPGLRVPLSRLKPLSNNVGQLFMSFITYATCSGFFFLLILLPCYARFSPGLFHNNVF